MAEIAEWPDEIDFARAEQARVRAQRRLSEHSPEMDVARAEMALKRALVRLGLKH
jgi:F-type H+-transporting ATPase subunit epsilon